MSDQDTYYILGTKYSRKEVEELEKLAGKTTLAGDLIRFNDACDELGRAVREAYTPFFATLKRFALRVRRP